MTRPVWRIGPSSAVSSVRSSARSPTPGISVERALRGTWMRMRGASPCSSVSHSVGTAISSPSRSRSVMSASTTEGRVPAWCSFLRRFSTAPSSVKVAQHVTQRGAVVVLQAEGARDLAHAGLALVRADEGDNVFAGGKAGGPRFLGGLLQDDGKVGPGRRNAPARPHSAAVMVFLRLRAAFFFGFAAFLASAARFRDAGASLRGPLRRGAGLAPVFSARASISADRLVERDLVRHDVVRDRRVDAVVGHVRAVAALLDQDRPPRCG